MVAGFSYLATTRRSRCPQRRCTAPMPASIQSGARRDLPAARRLALEFCHARQELLLVEDNARDRRLICDAVMALQNVEVVVQGHRSAALGYLRGFSGDAPAAPGVIFLDLALSSMSGFDVLRELKLQANAFRIPTVLFTASQKEVDVNLSYHLGANADVIKPQDSEQFRAIVAASAAFRLNTNVLPSPH